MNLSAPFIRRPVMTTLVMGGILVFGALAYRELPVSDLPNVDFPTLQVSASLPGASPETMAAAVATPLERQFTTIAGLDAMTSTSGVGSTQITLQFDLRRDLDAAAQDVQAAIAKTMPQLPRDLPSPPSYTKVNPADQPIVYIALTSPTLPLPALDEYGQTFLAQRISTVRGVAQVQVFGAQKYAVRIRLDPDALASRGIGLDEVAAAVQAGNVNLPTGTLWGRHRALTVEADGQLDRAAAYRPLIVAWRNGSPVRLEQIGRVEDGTENDKVAAWFNARGVEQRAVVLAVQRQPGTNTVEVADSVRSLLPSFRAQLPGSVSLHVLFDRSDSIRASVRDVQITLLLTLVLVVTVIFLFLRNVSATLIPSLALPMSVVGTFTVMYLLGYSLDNLSLMALTLSVGFVVDDAIVMLENVVRHLEMGKRPMEAALDGSREIGFTIVSMTISLAAVFIPVLFMGGMVGRLFREFAVTIGVAVLVSGFVSLTLTPMLCGRFLKPDAGERHGRLYAASERAFAASLSAYRVSLRWALAHRGTVLALTLVVVVATVVLFFVVPKGFLPEEDTGQVFCPTEAAEGISFEAMVRNQRAAAAVVRDDPDVESFMSSAGSRGAGTGANAGMMFLRLKPRSERESSAGEVVSRLRKRLARVPGLRSFPQVPPSIRIGGRLTKSQYQYTLQGQDTDQLYRVAAAMEAKLRAIPGLIDVTSDLQLRNPQVEVSILRDRASALGVSAAGVEGALYDAYGSRQVSTILAPNNQYRVIMEVEPERQTDPEALSTLYVRSSRGQLVPLGAVATLRRGLGPLSVNHSGQLPSVTLSFNLGPGVALGTATAAIESAARATVPAEISTSFQGTAQMFRSSMQGLGTLLVLTILVIYLVLGVLYESYVHPLTILSALPFAGVGAFLTLLAFRTDLSIYAFVGVVMLVGLVKKNGIMMVDFAVEAQRAGTADPAEAVFQASVVRFRPIMMTTMAALVGTLPIALGFGAGAESRRPLGLAVVGGLLFSQFLTLYVTPVVFVGLDRLSHLARRRRTAAETAPAS